VTREEILNPLGQDYTNGLPEEEATIPNNPNADNPLAESPDPATCSCDVLRESASINADSARDSRSLVDELTTALARETCRPPDVAHLPKARPHLANHCMTSKTWDC